MPWTLVAIIKQTRSRPRRYTAENSLAVPFVVWRARKSKAIKRRSTPRRKHGYLGCDNAATIGFAMFVSCLLPTTSYSAYVHVREP